MRSRKNKSYTFEFKMSVVELYLTTETSYQDLVLKVGLKNTSLVSKWVNDYRIAGPDVLQEKRKGRIAKNSVNRRFRTNIIHQKITTDTTEFKYYGNVFYSFDELKAEIERFIEYYNNKRTKQKLGFFSPVEYRLKYQAA